MKLSKTSAHAALAMAFLAAQTDGKLVQARMVAEHLGIPTDSALKILQSLARRNLLRSQLGRTGGYQLHRPGNQISLLEVVEAVDGPITADVPIAGVAEHLAGSVAILHNVWATAAASAREHLQNRTVADLLIDG